MHNHACFIFTGHLKGAELKSEQTFHERENRRRKTFRTRYLHWKWTTINVQCSYHCLLRLFNQLYQRTLFAILKSVLWKFLSSQEGIKCETLVESSFKVQNPSDLCLVLLVGLIYLCCEEKQRLCFQRASDGTRHFREPPSDQSTPKRVTRTID